MMREKLIHNRTEIRLLPFLCEQKNYNSATCDLPKACISSSIKKDCCRGGFRVGVARVATPPLIFFKFFFCIKRIL